MKTVEELLKDPANWAEGFTTRDGRAVRIYASDADGIYPVHGAFLNADDEWCIETWTADGSWRCEPNPCDLIPRPVKKRGWLNVYEFSLHPSKTLADQSRERVPTLACIEVEFTEGEGL